MNSSARRSAVEGTRSEVLSTKVLPQAMAIGNIHIGTMAGKLNGVMPAHTPTGWRTEWLSTSVPTFSEKVPFSRCGAPQANSTTSMPRVTEPRASLSTLPCSADTSCASSSRCRSSSSLKRNSTAARRSGGVSRQAGKAAAAASTAAAVSEAEASGTRALTLPSAGS